MAEDALLDAAQFAGALAVAASLRFGAWLCAPASATGAWLIPVHVDGLVGSERGLLERDAYALAQVGSTAWPSAPGSAAAEKRVENVAKATEAKALEAARAAEGLLRAGMSEAVVHGPSLLVGEHFVRLVDGLELFAGIPAVVTVRVVLHGQLPERLFDVFGRGVLRNA